MTSNLKNVCIDKLDNIVNKFNNTYHSTIEMKPFDVKSCTRTLVKKLMKIQNLKLVIMLEYRNIKKNVEGAMFQIGLKKFL